MPKSGVVVNIVNELCESENVDGTADPFKRLIWVAVVRPDINVSERLSNMMVLVLQLCGSWPIAAENKSNIQELIDFVNHKKSFSEMTKIFFGTVQGLLDAKSAADFLAMKVQLDRNIISGQVKLARKRAADDVVHVQSHEQAHLPNSNLGASAAATEIALHDDKRARPATQRDTRGDTVQQLQHPHGSILTPQENKTTLQDSGHQPTFFGAVSAVPAPALDVIELSVVTYSTAM